MKNLRTFFMEDPLENNRFKAKFNLGESGGRPRTVQELLTLSDLSEEKIVQEFLKISLCDSPNWGRPDLREIVSRMHAGSKVENVLITTGTSEALFLLFRYLKPKSVALAIPGFQLLYELPLALESEIIPLPVRWNQNGIPTINESEWLDILKEKKPECILINNPHNPSGLVLSQEFIDKIMQISLEISATIIGDEHYRFLSHETQQLGFTIYKNSPKVFVTGSFIKCLGCPGLRIGWCVGPTEALSYMQNEKNYTTHTVNPITEWISYEVLKNFESKLFLYMKEEWLETKRILKNFLDKSQAVYGMIPNGGLVTSLGLKKNYDIKSFQYVMKTVEKNGIFVLPLAAMEVGSFSFQKEMNLNSNHGSNINQGIGFRLGLGSSPQDFKSALEALELIL